MVSSIWLVCFPFNVGIGTVQATHTDRLFENVGWSAYQRKSAMIWPKAHAFITDWSLGRLGIPLRHSLVQPSFSEGHMVHSKVRFSRFSIYHY